MSRVRTVPRWKIATSSHGRTNVSKRFADEEPGDLRERRAHARRDREVADLPDGLARDVPHGLAEELRHEEPLVRRDGGRARGRGRHHVGIVLAAAGGVNEGFG